MLRKVLVANRGEIALRVIRTCKEMGVRTVAVYSEADRWANYVSQADESYLLGPALSRESYLRIDKILGIATKAGADAIHPGYGFLAENADFSAACAKEKIKFIGPPAGAIRAIGNKVNARRLAESLGIPVVPGVSQHVDERSAMDFARAHSFPVLLKAAAGGGGRGMRVVRNEHELPRALREASGEAASAFGDGSLFIEKLVEFPRHVEIQLLADAHGQAVHLGERECSVQRRHQKLLEESPSTALDDDLRERMGQTAVKLALAAGYQNAGTCEFLLDREHRFYFLEVNSRLQVEHPVTEMITGLDLVRHQMLIAAGEKLPIAQADVRRRGHAIECRICAEDPFSGFAPSIGEVTGVRFPTGPFVRVDSDLTVKSRVTPYYDSLIAKLIVWGEDRPAATARMARALRECKIVGVQTTIPFHLQILQDRRFREGRIHTKYVDDEFDLKDVKAEHRLEAALLSVALEHHRSGRRAPEAAPQPLSAWQTSLRELS
ncbi:MAG: acetyl-CoA carboxylase biotin carboxylase subunit [Planctomycetes bacterium]|nr:acetyl-CoA carboxylase biotin carboxylase subunit [Planctomycetota bacterium]